jgi:hypothetical protein
MAGPDFPKVQTCTNPISNRASSVLKKNLHKCRMRYARSQSPDGPEPKKLPHTICNRAKEKPLHARVMNLKV